jgi:cytochrome b6-f complex iron-sulfur subunit
MTRTNPTPAVPARRRLLNWLWLALGGVLIAQLFWVVRSFLKPLKTSSDPGRANPIVDVGPVDQFAPNSVTAFPRGRFYLARLEDGGFLALSRRCTHLGCSLPWDPQTAQFACPCHASVFDIRGQVVRSPAPRPLDHFAITIVNHRLMVASGQPIRRSGFRQSQVTYP